MRVIAVVVEVAAKAIEKGTHVEDVVTAESVNVWLVPPADAKMDTGGPPHLLVYDPRKKEREY